MNAKSCHIISNSHLIILQVVVLVKSDCTTYVKENGELEYTCDPQETRLESEMVTNASIPSCFKTDLIVFYDNHFKDAFTIAGPPTVDESVERFVYLAVQKS